MSRRRAVLGLGAAGAVGGWAGLGGLGCRALAALAPGAAVARGAADPAAAVSAHFPFGPVVPARPLPPWPVTTAQGTATPLAALLLGKVSALQLMFTGCSATCPIQGALFAQAQRGLASAAASFQFISLSIDPLSDTPAALAAWLRKMAAGPGWLAATPRLAEVDQILARLGDGGEPRPGGSDPHTGQVYIINRRGELAYRTASLPDPGQIIAALRLVAGQP